MGVSRTVGLRLALILGALVVALVASPASAQEPSPTATVVSSPTPPTPVPSPLAPDEPMSSGDPLPDNVAFMGIGVVVVVVLGAAAFLALRREGDAP